VIILRRAHEDRRLGGGARHRDELLVRRNRVERPQREVVGVGDAIGRTPAGFPVFVVRREAVGNFVVAPQVHRARIGRPQPHAQLADRRGAVKNLEGCGRLLPKILHADGEPARHVGQHRESARAVTIGHVQPRGVGGRAFHDRPIVRPELRELRIAPHRHAERRVARARIEIGEIRHALARKMRRVEIGDRLAGLCAVAGQHADRLRPDAAVGVAGEAHVAVVQFLLERNLERQPEAFQEILGAVAVVDERVRQLDLAAAGKEIKSHGERQPAPSAARGGFDVAAFEFDDGAHGAALLERHPLDGAAHRDVAARGGLAVIFADGDERAVLRDDAIADRERLDHIRTVL